MRPFGVVVLAAGASSRMGQLKQLMPFEGESLVHRAARVAVESGAMQVVVVLGNEAERVESDLDDLSVLKHVNIHWADGIASSIQAGLVALQPEVEVAVIALCDQPHVTSEHLAALAEAVLGGDYPIAASEYEGVLGVPAAFERAQFSRLFELKGDEGAKELLRNSGQVLAIPFEGAAVDWDVLGDV